MSIAFTQFLRPHGHTKRVTIDRPEDIEGKALDLRNDGLSFEIEELSTGEISMTIEDHEKEETVCLRVCANGPDVPVNVDEMVNEAFEARFPERQAND